MTAADSHEYHYFLNRLTIDGEDIAEYDYSRKDIAIYQDIAQKDIPEKIMQEMVKDLSRSPNIPWNVEHDDFCKAGAPVAWIQ